MTYHFRSVLGVIAASATFLLPVSGAVGGAGGDVGERRLSPTAPTALGIASGRVADAADKPIADARIVAYAWPTQEEMSRLGVGDEFDLIPVAAVRSASDGSHLLV